MKIWPVVMMFLGVTFGAVVVLCFRGPVKSKKSTQREPQMEQSADEPSRREAALVPRPAATAAQGKIGVDPKWSTLNKQAIQALESSQNEQAVALFEQCVDAVPDEKIFRSNLAEALARASVDRYDRGGPDGLAGAIAHLERAALLAPERDDIEKRLSELRALSKSEEGMWTDATLHFELSYDGARDELLFGAAEITNTLESVYQDLGELFGFYPVEQGRAKIRVVLYRRQGFHELTGIGHWAGGLYDGSVRVPVENLGREKRQLERVLRHELVHAFVHELGGKNVPGWLNEGLAQLHETDDLLEQARALELARKQLRSGAWIPLGELGASLAAQKDDDKIARAYAQGLALCAWIEEQFGERVMFEMVAACKRASTPMAAFEQRVGSSFERALETFLESL